MALEIVMEIDVVHNNKYSELYENEAKIRTMYEHSAMNILCDLLNVDCYSPFTFILSGGTKVKSSEIIQVSLKNMPNTIGNKYEYLRECCKYARKYRTIRGSTGINVSNLMMDVMPECVSCLGEGTVNCFSLPDTIQVNSIPMIVCSLGLFPFFMDLNVTSNLINLKKCFCSMVDWYIKIGSPPPIMDFMPMRHQSLRMIYMMTYSPPLTDFESLNKKWFNKSNLVRIIGENEFGITLKISVPTSNVKSNRSNISVIKIMDAKNPLVLNLCDKGRIISSTFKGKTYANVVVIHEIHTCEINIKETFLPEKNIVSHSDYNRFIANNKDLDGKRSYIFMVVEQHEENLMEIADNMPFTFFSKNYLIAVIFQVLIILNRMQIYYNFSHNNLTLRTLSYYNTSPINDVTYLEYKRSGKEFYLPLSLSNQKIIKLDRLELSTMKGLNYHQSVDVHTLGCSILSKLLFYWREGRIDPSDLDKEIILFLFRMIYPKWDTIESHETYDLLVNFFEKFNEMNISNRDLLIAEDAIKKLQTSQIDQKVYETPLSLLNSSVFERMSIKPKKRTESNVASV